MKISNRIWLKVLVDLGCTYTGINKQLAKEEWIKTKPMDR